MSGSEGFLGRWSRRKREATVTPAPAAAPPAAAAPAEALPEFDPASLPPIESLTADSDITAFLRPQVPAALRSAALRRAWTLDPAIRDYVGPADYAWDYNAADGMAGFSLELGGDVKRLLAQAIGLVEEEEKPPEASGEVPAEAVAEIPGPPAPLTALAAPPADLAAEPVPGPTPGTLPAPLAEPAPEAGAGPAPPAAAPLPRRHGGARPV
ncbi:DUF3306 domain-containing protein [Dankookia rubra]|uniref:DUF3306 domain-containing protein n=1 Tax=Dankookia rubra TaxID=1442381 RepID=A0A4R5QBL2_9PROT|nr:DUF3306 domain-containing protein [Dankookia rubra]TDH59988.1 DUF3306 domain-containing protein [Dankookia rubra]